MFLELCTWFIRPLCKMKSMIKALCGGELPRHRKISGGQLSEKMNQLFGVNW